MGPAPMSDNRGLELKLNRPDWKPNPGPQTLFLSTPAHEALYGGAAGGGKTDAILAEAVRQVANPQYRACIFQRTFPDLERGGGMIDRSKSLYPRLDARYQEVKHRWLFPAGSMIDFGHMQRVDDRLSYRGSQYAFIGFDELTRFAEKQYLYLFSRCRAPSDAKVKCYVRNATNPGGVGHEWVKRRWRAWLDKSYPNPAQPGELRWYVRDGDDDVEATPDTTHARSRTFIPARICDNPYLANTDYEAMLNALPLVERRRLRDGDWDIMPIGGMVFRREWFEVVEAAPSISTRVRFWDLAATEKKRSGDDPDYTVGARISATTEGLYYIEHIARTRTRWQGVKALIHQTAEVDGQSIPIRIEQEPGSSGKALIAEIVISLPGFDIRGIPARGDKLVRANPWSAQAEAGNVKLVRGLWNEAFLNEVEAFPEGAHDDQVDPISGGYQFLVQTKGRRAYFGLA